MPEHTPETLAAEVDRISAVGLVDDETAHSDEDKLATELIEQFAPDWARREWQRLGEATFARWCA